MSYAASQVIKSKKHFHSLGGHGVKWRRPSNVCQSVLCASDVVSGKLADSEEAIIPSSKWDSVDIEFENKMSLLPITSNLGIFNLTFDIIDQFDQSISLKMRSKDLI